MSFKNLGESGLDGFADLGSPKGKPFSPADLSPLLWFDGADAATLFTDSAKTAPVSSDGDVVAAWADKSGNGDDALQTTSGKEPLYNVGVQNGRSALLFDGADDFLQITGAGIAAFVDANVFIVARKKDTTQGVMLRRGTRFTCRSDPATLHNLTLGSAAAVEITSNIPASGNYLYEGLVETGGNFELLTNRILRDSDTTPAGLGGTSDIFIGAFSAAPSGVNQWDDYIMEILVFDRLLTISQRERLETFLMCKWLIS